MVLDVARWGCIARLVIDGVDMVVSLSALTRGDAEARVRAMQPDLDGASDEFQREVVSAMALVRLEAREAILITTKAADKAVLWTDLPSQGESATGNADQVADS